MTEEQILIKRNRFSGFIIIAMILLGMIMAYVMFHTGWLLPSGTTNKGELLRPPVALQTLSLTHDSPTLKALFTSENTTKRWRLLVPVTADCGEICRQNLYVTRQVHIRLAEKAYRVERIILQLGTVNQEIEAWLQQNHPNVIVASSTHEKLAAWLMAANIDGNLEDYYYLIDQQGFAMMSYDTQHSGQDLLDDLKKLLKFTYEK